MLATKFLKLILVFTQLYAFVTAQCKFTIENLENETRIVATKNGLLFQIVDQDTIPVGTELFFICSDNDYVMVKCNTNNRFSHRLPIQNCDKPLKPAVIEMHDDACNAKAFMLAYKFQDYYLEIYRTCFDKDGVRVLATSHIANPYNLVTNRPTATFTRDGLITVRQATSYQARSIFNCFKKLLGSNQHYITTENEIVIDRGHLVPSGDYLFESNMNATFKYINVIPQFSSINRGNWKTIENYVRRRVIETDRAYIYTGALEVLELKDQNNNRVPIYLADNQKNPIPKWIYKMFLNAQDKFVFVTYNNIFEQNVPNAICRKIACPIQLRNTKESGFTYCCDPDEFVGNILISRPLTGLSSNTHVLFRNYPSISSI